MRSVSDKTLALMQCLVDQTNFALLQVTQTTMNELAAL